MTNVPSVYTRCWMLRLVLARLIAKFPILSEPHPLYDLWTQSIAAHTELLGHGMVWDFEDGLGYAWVKEESDARYIKESWDQFVEWALKIEGLIKPPDGNWN